MTEETIKKIQNDLLIIKLGVGTIVFMLLVLVWYISIRLGGPLF